MSEHPNPDPRAVARGAEIIKRELEHSLIMPRPAAAICAILRILDSAYVVLSEPTGNRDPYLVAAGVATGIVDGYRRELAGLGAQR